MRFVLGNSVGDGFENDPEDVANLEEGLTSIGAFSVGKRRPGPLPVITPELDMAISRYQSNRGLKVDGVLHPGGPTERAIQNDLAGKPKGAGLVPPALAVASGRSVPFRLGLKDGVGEGEANVPADVKRTKQALAAIGLIPEDPFDEPAPYLDGASNGALVRFQEDRSLKPDALARPGGPTEAALEAAVNEQLVRSGAEIEAYLRRKGGGATRLESGVASDDGFLAAEVVPAAFPRSLQRETSANRDSENFVPAQVRIPMPRPNTAPSTGYGPPFPAPEIPTEDQLREFLRFLAGAGLSTLFPGTGLATIALHPEVLVPDRNKPNLPIGSSADEERKKTPVLPGYPSDGPSIPPLEGFQPADLKNVIVIKPEHYGIKVPIIVENARGNEVTQSGNTDLAGTATDAGDEVGVDVRHTGGAENRRGERLKEEIVRDRNARKAGSKTLKGSVRPDITLEVTVGGRTCKLYINTYDRLKSGDPTPREDANMLRLLYNMDECSFVLMAPKLLRGESYNTKAVKRMFKEVFKRMKKGIPRYNPNDPASRNEVMKKFTNIIDH